MKQELTKEERDLLKAKTPKAYIEKSLQSNIPSGRKAFLTKLWLDQKGFSAEDIKYHRNRHPYWKAKKMEGTAERNAQRVEEHDYSKGKNLEWKDNLIKKFLELNKKTKSGKYEYKDWELAKKFKCTIPVIQHMRRKCNMAEKIIKKKYGKITGKRLFDMVKLGENTLRKLEKSL